MAQDKDQPDFLSSDASSRVSKESRSLGPWIVAAVVILLILGVLLVTGRRPAKVNPGGAGLAVADPYAASLPLSNVHMSESSSLSGMTQTYIDGTIVNRGNKTVNAVTVQVAFRDFTNMIGQKETMPLSLIRTHEPYIDTEPVSAAPIHPGETREFRLIFDQVTASWNQQYPEIRIIGVDSK